MAMCHLKIQERRAARKSKDAIGTHIVKVQRGEVLVRLYLVFTVSYTYRTPFVIHYVIYNEKIPTR